MSKIGKKPIDLLEGVTFEQKDGVYKISGKLGTVMVRQLSGINAVLKDREILVTAADDLKQTRANWGTLAALLRNAVVGVTSGFKKELEIQGVGFRATLKGKTLVLSVGFSHPIEYNLPEGVAVAVEKSAKLRVVA